jgi:hypothetical protein
MLIINFFLPNTKLTVATLDEEIGGVVVRQEELSGMKNKINQIIFQNIYVHSPYFPQGCFCALSSSISEE